MSTTVEQHTKAIKEAYGLGSLDITLEEFAERYEIGFIEKDYTSNITLFMKLSCGSWVTFYTDRAKWNIIDTGSMSTQCGVALPRKVFRQLYEMAHSSNVKTGAIDISTLPASKES